MTTFEEALAYIERGWRLFPCTRLKRPLCEHGVNDATRDPAVIAGWLERWPAAWLALSTGGASDVAVLDVDTKHPEPNGFHTLARIDTPILPWTPVVRTPSGGAHAYFKCPPGGFPCTQGAKGRGIGPGLDWRCDAGYVILPSAGNAYRWDSAQNLATAAFAEVPPELLPREPEPVRKTAPVPLASGLSRYAERAIRDACENIVRAGPGDQEATLHREVFSIGTLAGAGAIPANFAEQTLLRAAHYIQSYDTRRPWRAAEIDKKVQRSFAAGMARPRNAGRA